MTFLYPNGTRTRPTVTSAFGPRRSFWTPAGWTRPYHYGVDLVGFDVVRSPVDGTVTFAGWHNDFGWLVVIREDSTGHVHRLAHHARLYVERGQKVSAGDPVGVMGTTGMSTAVHSHWEVIIFGVRIDPIPYAADRNTAAAVADAELITTDQEEEMPIVYVDEGGKVFALDTITGKRRHLSAIEWRSVRRAYKAAGRAVPLGKWDASLAGL